ncbi:MAG TPA: hypothetical protein VJ777_10975, partial [Mycobacterium sp.]|nr:hypothetical protein [Mycobacterium sp.]
MNESATLQQIPSPRADRWRASMTASRIPSERTSFTSPIINYEPAPLGAALCPPPSPAALHRSTPRRSPCPSGGWGPGLRGEYSQRPVASRPLVRDPQPPHAAVVFADAALRRVLEV